MKKLGAVEERKKVILEQWFREVAETYPAETARFLRTRADRFANPVGHALRRGLEGLLDSLVAGAGKDELASSLDEIVRVRAVQQFSPSAALAFVFSLKGIVRRACGREGVGLGGELDEFESRVDALALLAFDNYMDCRETLFEIRVKELKDMVAVQTRNMWKDGGRARRRTTIEEPGGGQ